MRIEGHYEVQEVAYGKDYVWQPGHALIECDCGQALDVDEHHAICPNCGAWYERWWGGTYRTRCYTPGILTTKSG